MRRLGLLALLLAGCGESPAPPRTEAQKLLAEAGFPGGRGFPELTLLYNTAESHKRLAAAVQEGWRDELGIEVRLANMEWRVFMDRVKQGDFDIARRAWVGEYMAPRAFLELFMRESGSNPTGWNSEEYDRLVLESPGEAEEILLREAPLVPIFHYRAHNFVKPFVKGVFPNARDVHPLQHVRLEGEGAPKDGVLIFNAGEEPGSLDPAISDDIGGFKTLMNLFEGLAGFDPREATPVPAAAERWDVSDDGRRYTFRLRPAKWSNGEPLTAGDFVYAWRRVVDPATASSYAHRMYVVRNAREIARGGAPPDSLGVRAVDDRTLEVDLVHPAPWFPELVCLNLFYPVHRATVEKHGRKWTRPEHLVGNGPFRLESRRLNDRKVFVKNPLYRAADEVTLEKVVFLSIPDAHAAFRAYEAGQCHWLFQAPLDLMDRLKERPDHLAGPYNAVYFYVFNVRKKPLDDPRVRRALSLAIDRERIVRSILRGGETPATRLIPPSSQK